MGLPYMYGVATSAVARGAGRDARRDHAAAGVARLLGPQRRPLAVPCLGRKLRAEASARRPRCRWSRADPAPAVAGRDHRVNASLLALALPALDMRLGFPDAGNDPTDTTTRQAYDLHTRGLRPGLQRPAADRRRAARRRGRRATSTRCADARSRATASRSSPRRSSTRTATRRSSPSIPTTSPQDEETEDLVNDLRDDVVPADARRHRRRRRTSAGSTAALDDQSDYVERPAAAVHRRRSSACRSCCCWWCSARC